MSAGSCLVIGGRGFVGSALAAEARSRDFEVSVVSRGDSAALAGRRFDVVIFAGGNARRYLAERDPAADLEANVSAVYRAIADFPCERFVLISSVDVYARPDSPKTTHEDAPIELGELSTYGLHKRLAEIVVERNAPGWLVLRLGQMVGPGLVKGPVFDALKGEPLRVAPASRYPFLQTSSVATIAFELVARGERQSCFNVCASDSAALEDVLAVPLRASGQAPIESYAIDVSQIAARISVPRAADEVRAFLEQSCSSAS